MTNNDNRYNIDNKITTVVKSKPLGGIFIKSKGGTNMTAVQTETLLKTENKVEAAEVMKLLEDMTPAQMSEIRFFIQGVRFANASQSSKSNSAVGAVQTV